jgi:hypothetical protein
MIHVHGDETKWRRIYNTKAQGLLIALRNKLFQARRTRNKTGFLIFQTSVKGINRNT